MRELIVNRFHMKILKIFAEGFFSIVDSYIHPQAYVRPSERGFYDDQMNLVGDVKNLGNDMRKSIGRKHVERAYQGSRH